MLGGIHGATLYASQRDRFDIGCANYDVQSRDCEVNTLPLAGRDQGWGAFGPDIRAKLHPLPTSPVEGEVPLHSFSKIATESTLMNWDDVRIFLAVARSGQILGAARALGLNHATVAPCHARRSATRPAHPYRD